HNVFKAAQEYDLYIDYGFWLSPIDDFSVSSKLEPLEEEILDDIQQLKHKKSIYSWHFSNDILSYYTRQYKTESIQNKQQEYSDWIRDLTTKIKAEDATRPIVVSLDLNEFTIKHTKLLLSKSPPIDALAINIQKSKDSCFLDEFIAFANSHKIAFQLGAVHPME